MIKVDSVHALAFTPAPSALRRMSRRELLTCGLAVGTGLIVGPTFIAGSGGAWALELEALSPTSVATLLQMARDVYPHDSFGDELYVAAMKGHEERAVIDTQFKTMLEDGVTQLDQLAVERGSASYLATGWEADRIEILRVIESDPFFQTIRGGLVVGLYNQPAVWALLGYEGASFDKGGYIDRGFDDIAWL